MSPEISVVICTFDRADLVADAVESLARQTLDRARFEVIVVDNGPTPTVEAALGDKASMPIDLRVVREERTGLSHARNRGTDAAAGAVVLFMDDDALAEPGLLEAHLRGFSRDDAPVATGGRIHLRWPGPRPTWVPASLESYYSGLDLGDEPRRLVFPEYPYGANMAIRRDVLRRLGGFSTELGRRGRNLISGEEKDLFLKVADSGQTVDYLPDAVVHHCVLPERVSQRWLLRRSWAQGRSDIAMGLLANGPMPRRRLVARAGVHLGRAVRHAAAGALAVFDRGAQGGARRVGCASHAMRWLGAAYEGIVRARGQRPAA